MLVYDELTSEFVGGSVYQAFLSALTYHRCLVSGMIVKGLNVPGTDYSGNYFEGLANTEGGPDAVGPNNSQACVTRVAARAVVFIASTGALAD